MRVRFPPTPGRSTALGHEEASGGLVGVGGWCAGARIALHRARIVVLGCVLAILPLWAGTDSDAGRAPAESGSNVLWQFETGG